MTIKLGIATCNDRLLQKNLQTAKPDRADNGPFSKTSKNLLGYANVKIYKCTAPRAKCPPPQCYQACGGAQKEAPQCKRCEGPTELVSEQTMTKGI